MTVMPPATLRTGRPGVNPLHVTRTHRVTADDLAHLTRIYERLGLGHVPDEKIRLGFAFPPASVRRPMPRMSRISRAGSARRAWCRTS